MIEPDSPLPKAQLRVMQIIASSILFSSLVVLCIFVLLGARVGNAQNPPNIPVLSIVAVVLFAIQAPLAYIVPAALSRTAIRRLAALDASQARVDVALDVVMLMNVRLTTLIVGLAMLEGATLVGCIAFLVERTAYGLETAVVAMLLQLSLYPTEHRVQAWIDEQLSRLEALRRGLGVPDDVSTL
jgi:hypothetical protein